MRRGYQGICYDSTEDLVLRIVMTTGQKGRWKQLKIVQRHIHGWPLSQEKPTGGILNAIT